MRVDRYKNFITEHERLEIASWFDININNEKYFQNGLSRGEWDYKFRKTTRQKRDIEFPQVILNIFDRIIKSFKFTLSCHKENTPSGDGIICVSTEPNGDTYLHKDPANCDFGNSVIRFNILIQKAEQGGLLSLFDENNVEHIIDVDECELYCCNLSDYNHSVSKVLGTKNRYIILFSICCPKDDWENYKISYKLNY